MGEPLRPTWTDLQSVIGLAGVEALLVSPFYSSIGLQVFEAALPSTTEVSIVTRFKLQDWAAGASNPVALRDMIQRFEAGNRLWKLYALQNLHAKAYIADKQLGLVGSANLTQGGFVANEELMILVEAEEATEAYDLVAMMISESRQVNLASLQSWVREFEPSVHRARKRIGKAQRHLRPSQSQADALLDLLPESPIAPAPVPVQPLVELSLECPDRVLCEIFTRWIDSKATLPGAAKLNENATDTRVGRNQGHFRRFFGSVWLFLKMEPRWQTVLNDWASMNGPEQYYDPSDELIDSWIMHLNAFAALQRNDVVSYTLVRRYLPPRFGGTVMGGGGGVSTFRRMLPAVSIFLRSSQAQSWHSSDPVRI